MPWRIEILGDIFGDRYRIRPKVSSPAAVYRNWRKVLLSFQNNRPSMELLFETAESGNLAEFERLYSTIPNPFLITDNKGRTATHQASAKNRVNILQFIAHNGGDLNVQDNAGNTPLHIAILNDSLAAIEFIMQCHNVKTNILNEKHQAPIHLITELNKVSALHVLSKYQNKIDIQQGGEHGRTALHLAAINDFDECARILITEFGASPRRPCNNGYYPIHEAAKNASAKTMEVFLQWGEAQGCSRTEMIDFYDAEGNVPLHSAVHGGDYKAVELCLRSGAKISKQQQDRSTPVHLACAQGAIEIVRLMFTLQPAEKKICLALCDVQKMTPLHCAAMFDHPEIVKYLVSEGADMNCLDKECRSPLLLAASRTGWRTVRTLIGLGANILLKDANQRNVLTLVVMNGGCLEEFAKEIVQAQSEDHLNKLLNEKDNAGCSPLHYASREGHIRSLESLIKLGACINLKNNKNESPLHFAARYGRYNTCKQLLDSEKGTFIINESDGEGLTPLHISSKHGHTRVVQLLLNRGALLHRDHNGRNPLHLAAMSGYTQTMELLLSVHSHLLDQADKDGNTALHLATMENKSNSITLLLTLNCKLTYNSSKMSAIDYAIQYKFPDAALSMVTHGKRGSEILSLKSEKYPCVTLALIASMPKVFEAVLDNHITKANCKKDSKSFYVKYNFSCLQCSRLYAQMDPQTGETLEITNTVPLPALNAMVTHGRVELLAHPLSQKYLQMKWHSYGKYFHLINLLFYTIFLVIVTAFAVKTVSSRSETPTTSNNYSSFDNASSTAEVMNCEKTTMGFTIAICLMAYASISSIREVMQMYVQKWNYLLDPSNFVSWLLYIAVTTMVFPEFMHDYCEFQSPVAAVTIFLSWFNLLLYLQRFDQVGIYVVMFLEILQTLLRVLFIFSILIIAFGLAFFILLKPGEHQSFTYVPLSFLRVFAMMLELDFVGTFVHSYFNHAHDTAASDEWESKRSLPYPTISFLMLVIFMVLMPILLMNLLIGLAVGDIESVRRNAQLKRLAMQVILHSELERKLPTIFLDRVDKIELIEFPNESKCKLGFMDKMLSKWFTNPFQENVSVDLALDTTEDYIITEITKQKRRLKEISTALETQQLFLRLIVQKMEIKTEADDVDEGISPNDLKLSGNAWTSPAINKKLRSVLSISKGPH